MEEKDIKPWEVGMLGSLGYLNGVLNIMIGLGVIYGRSNPLVIENVTDPAAIFWLGMIGIGIGVAYIMLTNWLMNGRRGGQGILGLVTVTGLLFSIWSIFAMTGTQLFGATVSAVSAVIMIALLFNGHSNQYFATHRRVQHGL